ncbi:MAG: DMT family transporter [Trichocoleus desertorum ATA4-8-CV12]|jgi:drug/metabolite transporter (DMT)-like permease|nr:DMT family transporter [Trichocoleus desertorum ATA4-8-CV12]
MLIWLTQFKGELAALSAAFLWAIASVIYTRIGQRVPPLVLNSVKGVIAIAFLVITLWLQGSGLPNINGTALGLLILSGVVGIGFGDTYYFAALNLLGPRRTLLLEALAPPLSAFLALLFLQETLELSNWLGIFLTIIGVTWVVSERVPTGDTNAATEKSTHPLQGMGYGLLAALGQAGGAVLSRAALTQSTISPLWSTLVRLAAGVLVLLVWLLVRRQAGLVVKTLDFERDRRRSLSWLGAIAITSFFSTYLGIWLQQTSLKFTAVGVAQALSSTSPLFILPIAIALGEVVSRQAILGVLVAWAGVWLLFS